MVVYVWSSVGRCLQIGFPPQLYIKEHSFDADGICISYYFDVGDKDILQVCDYGRDVEHM